MPPTTDANSPTVGSKTVASVSDDSRAALASKPTPAAPDASARDVAQVDDKAPPALNSALAPVAPESESETSGVHQQQLMAAALRTQRIRRALVLGGIALQVVSYAPAVAAAPPFRAARFALWIVAFGFAFTEGRQLQRAGAAPMRSFLLGAVYLVVAVLPFLHLR
jgi:hypothetical protein